jgi:phosphoribosylformylglycinamidine synthase
MADVRTKTSKGTKVLGICNGFQILTEAGLLPGALVRNSGLRFVCRYVKLRVENTTTFFTAKLEPGEILHCPVAHGEGNYVADSETLKRLEGDGRVVFRYADSSNPNGATNDIAGIVSTDGNVIGMMPHPENMVEAMHGRQDCRALFESLLEAA